MDFLSKKIFVAAGFNTTFMGPGRKEFNPKQYIPNFEDYLLETANVTCKQLKKIDLDEGVIGSFMSSRFLKQANLSGFLPFTVPDLQYKPCLAVEGACGTGSRAITAGIKAILSGQADSVYVAGFEMQNAVKPVYGADILAGASYYKKRRKEGPAHFFPGMFAIRAGEYFERFGKKDARHAMAKWYEQSILNARKNKKAQEYHNNKKDLLSLGMTEPDPSTFLEHLNVYDCSKISDGASSLILLSEEGLIKTGIKKEDTIEIISFYEAQEDITKPPKDETCLSTTSFAVKKALERAGIKKEDLGLLEIHDCFTITALLSLEAIGFAPPGKAPHFILDGNTAPDGLIPTNLSGGLGGFGHPTGATGVRQMVDLLHQLTNRAENQITPKSPYAMMVNMGGNDKTVSAIIVK